MSGGRLFDDEAKPEAIETVKLTVNLPKYCECGGAMVYSSAFGKIFAHCQACTPVQKVNLSASLTGPARGAPEVTPEAPNPKAVSKDVPDDDRPATVWLVAHGADEILDAEEVGELKAATADVYRLMVSEDRWFTAVEIREAASADPSSVVASEGLRRMRSLRSLGIVIDRQRVAGSRLFEYRITGRKKEVVVQCSGREVL